MRAMGKLGKLPVKHDRRTIWLDDVLDRPQALDAPAAYDVLAGREDDPRPMFGNDLVGDCTFAQAAHACQVVTEAATGERVPITDKQVLDEYARWSGWDGVPGSATDQGFYLLDLMKIWRSEGLFGLPKIKAFIAVNVRRPEQLQRAVFAFGGVSLGLSLPETIRGQDVWEIPSGGFPSGKGPGTLGGHATWMTATSPQLGSLITWGYRQTFTNDWLAACADEAYVVLLEGYVGANGRTPTGLNIAKLEEQLALVTA